MCAYSNTLIGPRIRPKHVVDRQRPDTEVEKNEDVELFEEIMGGD